MITHFKKAALGKGAVISSIAYWILIFCLSACEPNDVKPLPTITEISPTSGLEGSTVIITGANFSTVLAENIVKFSDKQAQITSATKNQLVVEVPVGAVTGKISVVTNNHETVSAADFSILYNPVVTAFSPDHALEGESITITGNHFSAIKENNEVKFFNNVLATITSASATQLVVTVPAGASNGSVTITTEEKSTTSGISFTVDHLPVINSFTPVHALPGAQVTITGNYFNGITTPGTNSAIQFNGVDAQIVNASETQLLVIVPVATTGKIKVRVEGYETISTTDFEVLKDIPRNGLIAYYPFTGDAKDASGNQLDGTLNGPTAALDRFGKASSAFQFDGNDYISMGNPSQLQIVNDITLSAWVNCNYTEGANILSKYAVTNQSGTNQAGYYLNLQSTGNNTKYFGARVGYPGSGAAGLNFAGGALFSGNEWVNFTFTITGSTAKWYKNGVEVFTATNQQPLTADALAAFEIGRQSTGAYFFQGFIDDVLIYNRVLSPTEVAQVYQQTITKY
jgi:hypothetical protein